MKDDNKKLGLILAGIVLVILIILVIYFTTYLFSIEKDKPNIPTTPTTKRIDEGFKQLSKEEELKLNEHFNSDAVLLAFNNAFNNNYELEFTDLFESEDSKFKFIYTYAKLSNISEELNYELINELSLKYFNTEIYEGNLEPYKNNDIYEYEINYELNHCLKVDKKKNDLLLINMIEKDYINCDINHTDYDKSLILRKIELKYEVIDNDYIYKSFIIVK